MVDFAQKELTVDKIEDFLAYKVLSILCKAAKEHRYAATNKLEIIGPCREISMLEGHLKAKDRLRTSKRREAAKKIEDMDKLLKENNRTLIRF